MENLDQLEAKYAELGKEIERLKAEKAFVPGWYLSESPYGVWEILEVDTPADLNYLKSIKKTVKPLNEESIAPFLSKGPQLYDWEDVPTDINWLAKDMNGMVWGYTIKPIPGTTAWYNPCSHMWKIRSNHILTTNAQEVFWRNSLEKRPE